MASGPVVVADRDVGVAAEAVVVRDGEEAVEAASRYASEQRPVLLAVRGAWLLLERLAERAAEEGFNPYLAQPLDPDLEPRRASLPLSGLAAAKLYSLLGSRADKAPARLDASKRASRRSLILRGPLAAIRFTPAPVLTDPRSCALLRSCRACTEVCPDRALRGKPPAVDDASCGLCGACLSACPVAALESTGTSERQLRGFVERVAEDLVGPGYLVLACVGSARQAGELLARWEGEAPLLVYAIAYPGEATLRALVTAFASGLEPAILCEEAPPERWVVAEDYARLTGGELVVAASAEELARRLTARRPRAPAPARRALAHPEVIRVLAAGLRGRVATRLPLAGAPEVDAGRCTLCGACAENCPTGALDLREEGGGAALILAHERCVACGICAEVCPHGALKLVRCVDPSLAGRPTPLLRDELLECIVCGRPLAPRRMVASVVNKLREAGVGRDALLAAFMCPDCKVRYQLGLARPRREPPLPL